MRVHDLSAACATSSARHWSSQNHADAQQIYECKASTKNVADIHEHMTRQRQKFAKAMKLKSLVTRIDGRASQGRPDFAPQALRCVAKSKPNSAQTAWTSSKKIGEKLTSTAADRKENYIEPSNSKAFMRKNPNEKRREFNPPRRRSETQTETSVGQV